MPNYTVMKTELPKLIAALTRAKNSGDPHEVLAAVNHAYIRFDVIGWPDSWPMWDIAKRDAEFKLVRRFT